jgi:hypothetical protein
MPAGRKVRRPRGSEKDREFEKILSGASRSQGLARQLPPSKVARSKHGKSLR